MIQSFTYSEPQLCDYGGDASKPWFVYFDIINPVTGEELRKQFRGGINYFHQKDERKKEGNALRRMWSVKLARGEYNPFKAAGVSSNPTLVKDAIEKVLDLKRSSLKRKSIRGYTDIKNMFFSWLDLNGYDKLRLDHFTTFMAQDYLDFLLVTRSYSGKSHNNHLGILKAFFNVMNAKGRKWVQENPFVGIEELPENIGGNLAYTEAERELLISYFKIHDRRLYYAVNFLFHGFIRKTELTTIKVGDINWDTRTIMISSDASKNRIQDSITITEGLMKILLEMGLDMAPKHFYIFGSKMETCERAISKPDVISDRHLICKRALEFPDGDGKTFYSWKHTGVVTYWSIVKDIYYMMRQLRHHDIKVTMVYLKSLGLMPNEAFRDATITISVEADDVK
jgi:integrase